MVCSCCLPGGDTDSDWLDSDQEEVTELAGVKRDHGNAGYRAGIATTKEQVLQSGFDNGYPEGAEIGLEVGEIIGKLQGLGKADLAATAREELSAAKLFSYDYYDKQAKPLFETHPLLKKWREIASSTDLAPQQQ